MKTEENGLYRCDHHSYVKCAGQECFHKVPHKYGSEHKGIALACENEHCAKIGKEECVACVRYKEEHED
jgi:hypothetical protein